MIYNLPVILVLFQDGPKYQILHFPAKETAPYLRCGEEWITAV
jgi:hypothetical protein